MMYFKCRECHGIVKDTEWYRFRHDVRHLVAGFKQIWTEILRSF